MTISYTIVVPRDKRRLTVQTTDAEAKFFPSADVLGIDGGELLKLGFEYVASSGEVTSPDVSTLQIYFEADPTTDSTFYTDYPTDTLRHGALDALFAGRVCMYLKVPLISNEVDVGTPEIVIDPDIGG